MPFFVEHGLTKAGATASNSVVKGWTAKGGRVLGTSRPVPIKHLLASSALGADQVQRVREYFLGLDASEEGRKKLEPIKYEGFAPYDEAEMLAIGKWLGLRSSAPVRSAACSEPAFRSRAWTSPSSPATATCWRSSSTAFA